MSLRLIGKLDEVLKNSNYVNDDYLRVRNQSYKNATKAENLEFIRKYNWVWSFINTNLNSYSISGEFIQKTLNQKEMMICWKMFSIKNLLQWKGRKITNSFSSNSIMKINPPPQLRCLFSRLPAPFSFAEFSLGDQSLFHSTPTYFLKVRQMHFEDSPVVIELPVTITVWRHFLDRPAVEFAHSGMLNYLIVICLFQEYESASHSKMARGACESVGSWWGCSGLNRGFSTDWQELQLRKFHHQQGFNGLDVVAPEVNVGEKGEFDVSDLVDHFLVLVGPCIRECVHKIIFLARHSSMRGAAWWYYFLPHSPFPWLRAMYEYRPSLGWLLTQENDMERFGEARLPRSFVQIASSLVKI